MAPPASRFTVAVEPAEMAAVVVPRGPVWSLREMFPVLVTTMFPLDEEALSRSTLDVDAPLVLE
jgi:hypothetical protein